MKKTILIIILLSLIGCKKEDVIKESTMSIYSCKGIPNENQGFSYMYFKNEKEGYLFGTLTYYQEMSNKDLNDPKFSPKSVQEANIFKTLDGGINWIKIDSSSNKNFYGHGVFYKNSIYIQEMNSLTNFENKLIQFNLSKEKKSILNYNFEKLGTIWNVESGLYASFKNKGRNNLLYFDENLNIIDSLPIENPLKNEALHFNGINYAITWTDGVVNLTNNKIIPTSLNPECLIPQDTNHMIIAGNNNKNDNEVDLVSYNVDTNKLEVIKRFKNYSIVQGLQSNEKVIAGFIGNISGSFTNYDLFYSLDNGKTWHIQKLEESSYIRPSYLIDNIMYIYSGSSRMQKIVLK